MSRISVYINCGNSLKKIIHQINLRNIVQIDICCRNWICRIAGVIWNDKELSGISNFWVRCKKLKRVFTTKHGKPK